MCELCYSSPCRRGCPHGEDPPTAVYTCYNCGAGIFDGEDYHEVCGVPHCDNCVSHEIAEGEFDFDAWGRRCS